MCIWTLYITSAVPPDKVINLPMDPMGSLGYTSFITSLPGWFSTKHCKARGMCVQQGKWMCMIILAANMHLIFRTGVTGSTGTNGPRGFGLPRLESFHVGFLWGRMSASLSCLICPRSTQPQYSSYTPLGPGDTDIQQKSLVWLMEMFMTRKHIFKHVLFVSRHRL